MKCNLGQTEKYVRLVLGVILFSLGLYSQNVFSGALGQGLLWFSLFLLLTAAFSWCPFTWARLRVRSKLGEPVPPQPKSAAPSPPDDTTPQQG